MTSRRHHRLATIALAEMVLAGCTATTAPSQLTAGVTTNPTATPPAFTIRPLPTPDPVPTRPAYSTGEQCPAITPIDPPDAEVELQWETPLGWLNMDLAVERTMSLHMDEEVWVGPEVEPSDYQTLRLRGADNMVLQVEPNLVYGEWTVSEASAVLHMERGGSERLEGGVLLQPGPEGELVGFSIPDVNATGYLEVRLEIVDECFAQIARVIQRVRVASTQFVATCPTDSEGFTQYWAELNTPPMRLAGVPIELGTASTSGTWTPYNVSAQGIVGFAEWDPTSESAAGDGGGTIRAGDGNPDFDLLFLTTDFYRPRAVVDYQEGGELPDRVFHARAKPYPDGHFDVLLPGGVGRYVASFYFHYESKCARGDGVGTVAVDVGG